MNNARKEFDALQFFCRMAAFPVELFVVRFGTWGARYLNFASVLGLFWPFFVVGFQGPISKKDNALLLLLWWASIAMLLVHRIAGIPLRQKGYICHSFYRGDSWFTRSIDPKKVERAHAAEILISFFVGVLIAAAISEKMGLVFILGSAALLICRLMTKGAIEARLRQMEDIQIENEYYGELFRQRTNRW